MEFQHLKGRYFWLPFFCFGSFLLIWAFSQHKSYLLLGGDELQLQYLHNKSIRFFIEPWNASANLGFPNINNQNIFPHVLIVKGLTKLIGADSATFAYNCLLSFLPSLIFYVFAVRCLNVAASFAFLGSSLYAVNFFSITQFLN